MRERKDLCAAARSYRRGTKGHKIGKLELKGGRVSVNTRARALTAVSIGLVEMVLEFWIKLVVVVLGDLTAIVWEIAHERH